MAWRRLLPSEHRRREQQASQRCASLVTSLFGSDGRGSGHFFFGFWYSYLCFAMAGVAPTTPCAARPRARGSVDCDKPQRVRSWPRAEIIGVRIHGPELECGQGFHFSKTFSCGRNPCARNGPQSALSRNAHCVADLPPTAHGELRNLVGAKNHRPAALAAKAILFKARAC